MNRTSVDLALARAQVAFMEHFDEVRSDGYAGPWVCPWTKGPAYIVFANGAMKPEGSAAVVMRDVIESIEKTARAVIDNFPQGGALFVRSPLAVSRDEEFGTVAARIRCVAVEQTQPEG